MNLKNNYLLKKLLKWAIKKYKSFNIYNVVLFTENKEKHLEISLFYTVKYETSKSAKSNTKVIYY